MIGKTDGPLVSKSLKDFILSIGARTSAPGGGSAAAAIGAIVSTTMVSSYINGQLR